MNRIRDASNSNKDLHADKEVANKCSRRRNGLSIIARLVCCSIEHCLSFKSAIIIDIESVVAAALVADE